MVGFIDPRSNPEPPARVSRDPAAHGEELREVVGLCSAARLRRRAVGPGRPAHSDAHVQAPKEGLAGEARSERRSGRGTAISCCCFSATGTGWAHEALATRSFDPRARGGSIVPSDNANFQGLPWPLRYSGVGSTTSRQLDLPPQERSEFFPRGRWSHVVTLTRRGLRVSPSFVGFPLLGWSHLARGSRRSGRVCRHLILHTS